MYCVRMRLCVCVWVCAPTISKSRATHTNNNPNFGTHAFPTHRKCCVERVRERAREGERQQHAHLRDTTRVFRNGVCEASVFIFLQKVFQIFLYFFDLLMDERAAERARETERERGGNTSTYFFRNRKVPFGVIYFLILAREVRRPR